MSNRKQKLEASLEGLFSAPKQPRPKTAADTPSPGAEEKTPLLSSKAAPQTADAPFNLSTEETQRAAAGKPAAPPPPSENLPAAPQSPSPSPQRSASSASAPITIGVKQTLQSAEGKKETALKIPATEEKFMPPAEMIALDEGTRVVTFLLSKNYYGIEISAVQTIIKPQSVCPVPFTPAYVEGLTNLRGQIVPIIDLRSRLGFPPAEINKDTRVIVISILNEWAGIRVDSVTGVTTLPADSIEPPSSIVSAAETNLLSGIARTDTNIILILDTQALFALEEKSSRRSTSSAALLNE